ncbi:hypothetical protein DMC01_05330 [Campylobacter troglodytis]|nr:hypothetical protein DMC01_05330 [Campylobacter troglodytis]
MNFLGVLTKKFTDFYKNHKKFTPNCNFLKKLHKTPKKFTQKFAINSAFHKKFSKNLKFFSKNP